MVTKKFDRETYVPEVSTADLIAKIQNGILAARSSDAFQSALRVAATFKKYSLYNTMLIAMQKPDATRVMGFWQWKDFGRAVMKGEKGIRILAPVIAKKGEDAEGEEDADGKRLFFKTVTVFDVSQTKGEPMPEETIAPHLVGEDDGGLFDRLAMVAAYEGLNIDRLKGEHATANGFYVKTQKRIWISPALGKVMATKTLAHELSHHFAEHDTNGHCREEAELIAEASAYIVLNAFGIDSGAYTFDYLAAWSNTDADLKLFKGVMSTIIKTSHAIIAILEGTPTPPPTEPLPPTAEVDAVAAAVAITTPKTPRKTRKNPPGWDVVDTGTEALHYTQPDGSVVEHVRTRSEPVDAIMGVDFNGTAVAGKEAEFNAMRLKAAMLVQKPASMTLNAKDGLKPVTISAKTLAEIAAYTPPPLPKGEGFPPAKLVERCKRCGGLPSIYSSVGGTENTNRAPCTCKPEPKPEVSVRERILQRFALAATEALEGKTEKLLNEVCFYTDPGHGWLKVPMALCEGFAHEVSEYSYRDGWSVAQQIREERIEYAYLEEDRDIGLFFVAYKLNPVRTKITEFHENHMSSIRRKPGFKTVNVLDMAKR